MANETSLPTKARRKHLRAKRKGFSDVAEEKEGLMYGAWEFLSFYLLLLF